MKNLTQSLSSSTKTTDQTKLTSYGISEYSAPTSELRNPRPPIFPRTCLHIFVTPLSEASIQAAPHRRSLEVLRGFDRFGTAGCLSQLRACRMRTAERLPDLVDAARPMSQSLKSKAQSGSDDALLGSDNRVGRDQTLKKAAGLVDKEMSFTVDAQSQSELCRRRHASISGARRGCLTQVSW